MGLGTAWAAITGLSWFSKVSGLVSFIPGVGPILGAVLGFVAALIQLVFQLLTNALKGVLSIMKNPLEICALITVAVFCIAIGIHWGVRYQNHLVKEARVETKEARVETKEARQEINHIISGLESADAEDQALAEAADTAAQAAEQLERERIAHEAEAKAGVAPGTKLDPPVSTRVADSPPVAGVPVGLLNLPAGSKDKNRRKKPEPSLLETFVGSVGNAFDASQW
jgi:hypothetical protein